MLVTAAPATRKQLSAMMVIAFDKPFSPTVTPYTQFTQKWALIKAEARRSARLRQFSLYHTDK
jgi:hypothetical protein